MVKGISKAAVQNELVSLLMEVHERYTPAQIAAKLDEWALKIHASEGFAAIERALLFGSGAPHRYQGPAGGLHV